MVEKGANVNIQDSFLGRSILMQAVIDENVEMVKKLLRKGANKRLRDHNNETALMLAEYNGNSEIINLLQ
ncbi:MAG: ankyrin repeat domain-containing protein [Alphaproteobacteria bacterium]|nr:ankyrin repeat domain-containing protein [Alphaproteobacteria bacterium]